VTRSRTRGQRGTTRALRPSQSRVVFHVSLVALALTLFLPCLGRTLVSSACEAATALRRVRSQESLISSAECRTRLPTFDDKLPNVIVFDLHHQHVGICCATCPRLRDERRCSASGGQQTHESANCTGRLHYHHEKGKIRLAGTVSSSPRAPRCPASGIACSWCRCRYAMLGDLFTFRASGSRLLILEPSRACPWRK
jgi:hypothetical protein